MREAYSCFQVVRSVEFVRRQLKDFLPFNARRLPVLAIKESPFSCLHEKLIRRTAVWQHVGVKFPVAQLRAQQASGVRDISMLETDLISPLVQIRSGFLRGECIQTVVVELLRKECKG